MPEPFTYGNAMRMSQQSQVKRTKLITHKEYTDIIAAREQDELDQILARVIPKFNTAALEAANDKKKSFTIKLVNFEEVKALESIVNSKEFNIETTDHYSCTITCLD